MNGQYLLHQQYVKLIKMNDSRYQWIGHTTSSCCWASSGNGTIESGLYNPEVRIEMNGMYFLPEE
jgi:hypothetical protein